MMEFITETLKPNTFWSALGSIGTLLAVIVALIQPFLTKRRDLKKMKNLVESEIHDNYKKIKNIKDGDNHTLPNGQILPRAMVNLELATHVKNRVWEQYKYQIASIDPEVYEKYAKINLYVDSIINEKNIPKKVKAMMVVHDAESFVKIYDEKYAKSLQQIKQS